MQLPTMESIQRPVTTPAKTYHSLSAPTRNIHRTASSIDSLNKIVISVVDCSVISNPDKLGGSLKPNQPESKLYARSIML